MPDRAVLRISDVITPTPESVRSVTVWRTVKSFLRGNLFTEVIEYGSTREVGISNHAPEIDISPFRHGITRWGQYRGSIDHPDFPFLAVGNEWLQSVRLCGLKRLTFAWGGNRWEEFHLRTYGYLASISFPVISNLNGMRHFVLGVIKGDATQYHLSASFFQPSYFLLEPQLLSHITQRIFSSFGVSSRNCELFSSECYRSLILLQGLIHDFSLPVIDEGLNNRGKQNPAREYHCSYLSPMWTVALFGPNATPLSSLPSPKKKPKWERWFWLALGGICLVLGIGLVRTSLEALDDNFFFVALGIVLFSALFIVAGIWFIWHGATLSPGDRLAI